MHMKARSIARNRHVSGHHTCLLALVTLCRAAIAPATLLARRPRDPCFILGPGGAVRNSRLPSTHAMAVNWAGLVGIGFLAIGAVFGENTLIKLQHLKGLAVAH